jgi:hypothetical protein
MSVAMAGDLMKELIEYLKIGLTVDNTRHLSSFDMFELCFELFYTTKPDR